MSSAQKSACPNCGCVETRETEEDYAIVCARCGLVREEVFLVDEVSIGVRSDGSHYRQGAIVDESGPRFGRIPGSSRDSRQVTLDKARNNIINLAAELRIPRTSAIIDLTVETYKLALVHGFVKGRPSEHVVAACLYIILRQEQTHHMLLDFADVLRTNVYVLGHTFLRLCQCLNIQLPVIDPSLYIPRFALMLEFEEKTQQVIKTAERLVQRMNRDWIQTGRRPAGICGAALLVAAKLHGFRRSQKDVIRVVRICEVTLRKRLSEFESTPVCDLTPAEFEAIDFEDLEACDPPAFTRLRLKEQQQQAEAMAENANNQIDDEELNKEMESLLESAEFKTVSTDGSGKKRKIENNSQPEAKRIKTDQSSESSTISAMKVKVKKQRNGSDEEDSEEEDEESLSDVDDQDIAHHLCSQPEVEIRRQIWEETHADYIKEQEEKQKLAEARQNAEGATQKKPRVPREKDTKKKEAKTAAEACKGVLGRLRRRLNTKVLNNMLPDTAAPASPLLTPSPFQLQRQSAHGKTKPLVDSREIVVEEAPPPLPPSAPVDEEEDEIQKRERKRMQMLQGDFSFADSDAEEDSDSDHE